MPEVQALLGDGFAYGECPPEVLAKWKAEYGTTEISKETQISPALSREALMKKIIKGKKGVKSRYLRIP